MNGKAPNGNGNGNGGNGRRNGNGLPKRAQRSNPMAGARLSMSVRSELQEAGLSLMPFFDSMMNPEDAYPMRIPDSYAGTTAVFKSPFVIDLPYSGKWDPSLDITTPFADPLNPKDGFSHVVAGPGTNHSIYHTLGSAGVTLIDETLNERDAAMIPVMLAKSLPEDIVDGLRSLGHGLRVTGAAATGFACLPHKGTRGIYHYEMTIGPEVQAAFTLECEFTNIGNISFVAGTRGLLSGTWEDGSDLSISTKVVNGAQDIVSFDLDPVADGSASSRIRQFSILIEDLDPSSQWAFSLTGSSEIAPISFLLEPFSACAYRVLNTPAVDNLSETESERTTALSILLTYMGSHLQDGGTISGARLGMGHSPLSAPDGDFYRYFAELPFYNDDYALKDGLYAWWLPDSVQEYFYVPYGSPRTDNLAETSLISCAMNRDDPNQGVRLRVIQSLEVITRSRLYAARPAPINPAYDVLVGVIKGVPAVTTNPGHKNFLSRAISKITNFLKSPPNWKKILKGGEAIANQVLKIAKPAVQSVVPSAPEWDLA